MKENETRTERAADNITRNVPLAAIDTNDGQVPGLPRNPRTIGDDRMESLKASIKAAPEMLALRPVIAIPHDGRLVALCGNMRVRACRELGIDAIPAIVLPDGTPPAKLREYAIKDNIGFGRDDWDALATDWDAMELESWGMEIPDEWRVNPDDYGDTFTLPDGDRPGMQQIRFVLADEQAEMVKACIAEAKRDNAVDTYGNANTNGNALYRIVTEWAGQGR